MRYAAVFCLCASCAQAGGPGGPDLGRAGDLSSFLQQPPDLAGADLTSPRDAAADLLTACPGVDQTFAASPTGWNPLGATLFDTINLREQLTAASTNTAGSVFYTMPFAVSAFTADFKYYIGDGSGSDGMAFVFAQATSYTQLGPRGNGSTLGYVGMSGYAVEFDTTGGTGDPNSNHVAFMQAATGSHLLVGTPAFALKCNCERQAHIEFTGSNVSISVDGTILVNAAVSGFVSGSYYFGFTGATGSGTDRHAVRDFHLKLGQPGSCF